MARMVRKQIYIDEVQDRGLKELATARGTTESLLIRGGIDFVLSGFMPVMSPDDAMNDLKRVWNEIDARRTREGVQAAGRDWTRDDLYEDD
jgi:hypothetical protein